METKKERAEALLNSLRASVKAGRLKGVGPEGQVWLTGPGGVMLTYADAELVLSGLEQLIDPKQDLKKAMEMYLENKPLAEIGLACGMLPSEVSRLAGRAKIQRTRAKVSREEVEEVRGLMAEGLDGGEIVRVTGKKKGRVWNIITNYVQGGKKGH